MGSILFPLSEIGKGGGLVEVPKDTMGRRIEHGVTVPELERVADPLVSVASHVLKDGGIVVQGVFGDGHEPYDYIVDANTPAQKVVPDNLLGAGGSNE